MYQNYPLALIGGFDDHLDHQSLYNLSNQMFIDTTAK